MIHHLVTFRYFLDINPKSIPSILEQALTLIRESQRPELDEEIFLGGCGFDGYWRCVRGYHAIVGQAS